MNNYTKLNKFLNNEIDGILFYTGLKDKKNRYHYFFSDPKEKIVCNSVNNLHKSFKKINSLLKKGLFVVMAISYEAGYLFENKLRKNFFTTQYPLIYLFAFKKPLILKNMSLENFKSDDFAIYNFNPDINYEHYFNNFSKIKNLIKNGEIYQLNYCFKLNFNFTGNPVSFFLNLIKNQKVSYSALFKIDGINIISLSPELFFRIKNDEIILKPMKGTLLKSAKNKNLKNLLNEKNKAENVMIVDLIRNDLGKICKINSISVPKLFHIEEYETLYQMTSEIRGKLKTKDFYKIFKALFPSGSVTGAPKIRAMELIKEFENTERKIYTGAIGFITPNKNAVFNIPIRTIVLKNNEGEIGIGSGIVYDSKAKSEYRECLGKAKFLLKTKKHFALIETMRIIKNKGYFLLLQHLSRLLNSCNFFKINCDISKIKNRLLKIKFDNDYKIRLLVFPDGKFKIEKNIYKENKSNLIDFSNFKTSSKNIFLYHKTTNREIYNKEYKNALKNGLFDVIFINEKDEITEGCISNIFIKKEGIFYTPPVKCGLLPGIYRNYLLNKDNKKYREKILFKKDILNADEIYLCNSVFFLKKVFYKGV